MIVILDNIRSKHNVGSIFRTADACGVVEKIYLCGITPAPVDPWGKPNSGLIKVALGAEETLAWESVPETSVIVDELRAAKFRIFALELHPDAVRYDSLHLPRQKKSNIALVLGPEIQGLSSEILRRATKIISIPMYGKKESLNVAVAFGIAVYGMHAADRDIIV